jgi:hypothetical protein
MPGAGAITVTRCTAAQNWLTGAPDLATAVVCVPRQSRRYALNIRAACSAGVHPVHLAENTGIDDAHIQPFSGHTASQSLEICSQLALADAQQRYDDVIGDFPVWPE